MNFLSTLCRRHRRLLLAVGYLLILALAVMYLRVTISVPPEGDDRLTLNKWMFEFDRTPFLEYLWRDLGERLRYFTLQEVRFFPFHYPSAFLAALLRQPDQLPAVHHRCDGGSGLSDQPVVARLSRSDALALGGFALALSLAPIFNEGMYSYYAVPQKALFWAMGGLALPAADAGYRPSPLGRGRRHSGIYFLRHLRDRLHVHGAGRGAVGGAAPQPETGSAGLCPRPGGHRGGPGLPSGLLPRDGFQPATPSR